MIIRLSVLTLLFSMVIASSLAKTDDSGKELGSPAVHSEDEYNHNLRTLSVRLTGSMCTACLKKLEEKLAQIDGVSKVAIVPKATKITLTRKAELHPRRRQANVQLIFDSKKISSREIAQSIKQSDFQILSVSVRKNRKADRSMPAGQCFPEGNAE